MMAQEVNKRGYVRFPIKTKPVEKEYIKRLITKELQTLPKLRDKTSRINVRGGHVYLYKLQERFPAAAEGGEAALVEGGCAEVPMARITIYDNIYQICTLDRLKNSCRWVPVGEGTLEACLLTTEQNDWF
jgi:hypothetical protein